MNILIAGGNGFLGSYLKKRFVEDGHLVRIVSRSSGDITWNQSQLTEVLNTTDVLINLAGKSINCRFTPANKEQILKSRIQTTHILNKATADCTNPPKVWINASATGIYEHTFDECLSEYSSKLATDFLATVVLNWENAFFKEEILGTRKIALRTSVVLGTTGGAFPLLNKLSKLGLGGKQGDGKQMVSWIFIEDYYRIVKFIIENQTISGVINASAPHPISNTIFMKELQVANRAFLSMPAPGFLLQIASHLLNFQPNLILDSTNVFSQKLKDLSFEFKAPDIHKVIKILNCNEK